MSEPTPEQLQIFLDIATEAAIAAGAILQSYWGNLEAVEEKGRPGDLVTVADKEAEAAILKVLKRHVPEHSILAEESGQLGDNRVNTSGRSILWMARPIMLISTPLLLPLSGY
jgi:myo-inositol-1(or 4)-monophosphatase